jgi:membrane-bound metal-dependent hydrolase YbcI (DUF457 family)
MLIGAVGGLAVFKVAERLDPSILSAQFSLGDSTYSIPTAAVGVACVAVSSVMALWPDLDKPDSFISHVASRLMWLPGGLVGLIVALVATHTTVWMVVGAAVGAILGHIAGGLILGILGVLSGGHRRLTHSILIGIGLVFGTWVLYLMNWGGVGVLLVIVAWGQLLHLAGDVVTPGGVALFYPIWPGPIYLVPHSFALFGEVAVGCIALVLGVVLFIWL